MNMCLTHMRCAHILYRPMSVYQFRRQPADDRGHLRLKVLVGPLI